MAKKRNAPSPARKSSRSGASHSHPTSTSSATTQSAPTVKGPVFSEPGYMNDPTSFKATHDPNSDHLVYGELDKLKSLHQFNPLPFSPSRGGTEPILTLAQAYGDAGTKIETAIQKAGQIVFHSAGDTGATQAKQAFKDEYDVIDKMLADFQEKDASAVPQFFYHLGDIVYSFGEHTYYYDQFYDAFRNYPAPVFAIPGNHDGLVKPNPPAPGQQNPTPGDPKTTLSSFLANFCTTGFQHSSDAVSLSRTTMIQPGVYYTLEVAPLVRILGIYSNMLENPGIISSTKNPTKNNQPVYPDLSDVQLDYLKAALTRVKTTKFGGAVILAVHHPPYTFGKHLKSMAMLKEIDAVCQSVGVWPHAVLSGHAHNYQRYTRTLKNGRQIPYVVCGNGGHPPLQKLTVDTTLRTPIAMPGFAQKTIGDTVTLDNYDFKSFGYLRIVVDSKQLRIEYHPEGDGVTAKTPDDFVTVQLSNGKLIHYTPPSIPINNQL